ncbi:MAG: isocitrate/isopropylmalate family dehydrogenase [Kosmotogaceae bacterium]
MGKKYKIAIIPGDGIGPEVITECKKVMDCISDINGIEFNEHDFPWGCDYYLKHGKMYDETTFTILKDYDAVLMGAVGDPRVPDHISVRLIIDTRFAFDQYINLRPIRRFKEAPVFIKGLESRELDFYIVRENTEGEYVSSGGRFKKGTEDEIAIQTSIFTRKGTERVMRYSFELAERMKKQNKKEQVTVTNCTKSNALAYSMVFWDEVFEKVASEYREVNTSKAMVDALTMWLIKNPNDFSVIVASNLFGDIITDLASILQGGMGFAAGANINPEKVYPSMFEPIHGSAPKYTGKGIVNPIAAIMSVKMMLEHLDEFPSAKLIEHGIASIINNGKVKTYDMGGKTTTSQVGDILCREMVELSKK